MTRALIVIAAALAQLVLPALDPRPVALPLPVAAAVPSVVAVPPPVAPAAGIRVPVAPVEVGSLEARLPVNEASGLVASRRHPGVLYWLRDGGPDSAVKPRSVLWALKPDAAGRPLPVREGKQFPFATAFGAKNVDWEDVVIDDDDNLWIGDIGANDCKSQQYLYKSLEPDPDTADPFVVTARYPVTFPDPAADCRTRNAEAMLWLDGRLYLFAKGKRSPVYRAERAERDRPMPLVPVTQFESGVSNISVSSISDDRARLMVAAHEKFWIFKADPSLTGDEYLRRAMSGQPAFIGRFRPEADGTGASVEGGSYLPGTRDLMFVAENKRIFHVVPSEYGDRAPDGGPLQGLLRTGSPAPVEVQGH